MLWTAVDWCFQEFDISWVNIFLKWISRSQYFIEMHNAHVWFFLNWTFRRSTFHIEKISLRFLESALLLINVFLELFNLKLDIFPWVGVLQEPPTGQLNRPNQTPPFYGP